VIDTNTADPEVNDVLDEGHFFLILKAWSDLTVPI
jgi:hypothetical protein